MSLFAKPTLIGININPKQLTCSIVETTTNKKQFVLKELSTFSLQANEYKNVTLFNITTLKQHILNFAKKHNAYNSYAVISFAGPGFTEKVINLTTGIPSRQHLAVSQNIVWDYQAIGYTRSTGKTHYYVCGLPRELLLQHQLLAHLSTINCIQIIPQRVAVLNALRFMFPDAWQTTTINNHATLQNFIDYYTDQCNTDLVLKNQTLPNIVLDKQTAIETIGTFLMGVSTYEQY